VVESLEFEALGDEGRHGVDLEVELQDGRSYREKVLHAKGSDKHPMTREEALQKFRLLATRVLSRFRVEQLEETLLNLEKLDDAKKLAKLLTA
jgi:2-methylcitrate dehydratase PrpD